MPKYIAISVYADGVGVDIDCAHPETPREERILEVALADVRRCEHIYIATAINEGDIPLKTISDTAIALHAMVHKDRRPEMKEYLSKSGRYYRG